MSSHQQLLRFNNLTIKVTLKTQIGSPLLVTTLAMPLLLLLRHTLVVALLLLPPILLFSDVLVPVETTLAVPTLMVRVVTLLEDEAPLVVDLDVEVLRAAASGLAPLQLTPVAFRTPLLSLAPVALAMAAFPTPLSLHEILALAVVVLAAVVVVLVALFLIFMDDENTGEDEVEANPEVEDALSVHFALDIEDVATAAHEFEDEMDAATEVEVEAAVHDVMDAFREVEDTVEDVAEAALEGEDASDNEVEDVVDAPPLEENEPVVCPILTEAEQ
jgi:hypothetical protein